MGIDRLLLHGDAAAGATEQRGMSVEYVGAAGKELMVEGWVVNALEVQTEPFGEVKVPGTGDVMGMVVERNFFASQHAADGHVPVSSG